MSEDVEKIRDRLQALERKLRCTATSAEEAGGSLGERLADRAREDAALAADAAAALARLEGDRIDWKATYMREQAHSSVNLARAQAAEAQVAALTAALKPFARVADYADTIGLQARISDCTGTVLASMDDFRQARSALSAIPEGGEGKMSSSSTEHLVAALPRPEAQSPAGIERVALAIFKSTFHPMDAANEALVAAKREEWPADWRRAERAAAAAITELAK